MPKNVPATIVLDQNDPKAGDTVTFTTTGGKYITGKAYYPYQGNWAFLEPVGTAIKLDFEGPALVFVWLDRDRNLANGHLASCSFEVDA